MEAYSQDLRDRVLAACDDRVSTRTEIAEQFGVSTAFIRRLVQRRREGHDPTAAAKPRSGGPAPLLAEKDRVRLRALVAAQPDATLAELRQQLAAAGGPAVSDATMCRALQTLHLPRKKKRRRRRSGTHRG